VPSRGTKRQTIRVDPDLWDEFGEATDDRLGGRSGVLRGFMRWFLGKPDAALPERPPPGEVQPMTEDSHTPEHPPVVAAIVTSQRGVLIGRRNDGKPPWTFIAGEIEPGESQADAAVREVKEETGLVIEPAPYEIGRRVHPKTGRTMIYLACTPKGKLDAIVGDVDELAEVKWASLAEVDELMPGVYEPVYAHLQRELS
jgi:8-oxo-dGTP pyrophosphatase MutT (NUDIX family)